MFTIWNRLFHLISSLVKVITSVPLNSNNAKGVNVRGGNKEEASVANAASRPSLRD